MSASIAHRVANAGIAPDAIREQLTRILASHYFSNSKRYPAMLRYVVIKAVEGNYDDLKERTLGVEVFQRPPDYDTNVDPVVRIAAGEIRKRLAQYYCDPAHEEELRIDVPSGSYQPEFHFHAARVLPAIASGHDEVVPLVAPAAIRPVSRKPLLKVTLSALAGIALLTGIFFWLQRSPTQQFWGPMLKSSTPVLICVGQPDYFSSEAATAGGKVTPETTLGYKTVNFDRVTMSDLFAASRLTAVLGMARVPYVIQGANTTSFVEMQKGPVVLLAAADNPWTLRITEPLRFHFVWGDKGVFRIEDRKNPAQHDWQVDFTAPASTLKKDYAIVGRFFDSTTGTGQTVIVVAGTGGNGTISGAEFASNPKYISQLTSSVPANARNVEAVIETSVIDGKSGPPRMLASHSW